MTLITSFDELERYIRTIEAAVEQVADALGSDESIDEAARDAGAHRLQRELHILREGLTSKYREHYRPGATLDGPEPRQFLLYVADAFDREAKENWVESIFRLGTGLKARRRTAVALRRKAVGM